MDYGKVTMVFGTVMKCIGFHVPLAEWEKFADEAWQWALTKVEGLEERQAIQGENGSIPLISPEQIRSLYGNALNKGGFTKEALKLYFKAQGINSLKDIRQADYQMFLDAVKQPNNGKIWNAK
jgi:hypothetical protein